MKKLMMALAVTVVAVATANAGAFSWKVTQVVKPKNADGDFGSGASYAIGADANFSVWVISATESQTALEVFNSINIADIYSTYNGTTATYSGATSSSGKTLTSAKDDYAAGTWQYAVTLLTYNDGTTDWYIANKVGLQIGADGDNVTASALHKTLGGTSPAGVASWEDANGVKSGGSITGWTKAAAVPEPTSGLLLVLGLAGLALRRRRA